MGAEESYRESGAGAGLTGANGFWPGPVTPLLAKGGEFDPALRGELIPRAEGVIARHRYPGEGGSGLVFNAVFARIPASQPFVARLPTSPPT